MKNLSWLFVVVTLAFTHASWGGRFEDACGELKHDSYARDQYEYCVQAEIAADSDCIECLMAVQEKPNPWVEVTENLAMPLTILGSTFFNAYYGYKNQRRWANSYDLSQKLWSDAFNNGINSCNTRFNSYLEYTTSRGAPPVLPEQVAALNECNGVSLQDFAGFQGLAGNGFGGFGTPFGGSGYSSGFLGGMAGPYFGGLGGYGSGAGMGVGIGPGALQAGLGLSVGIPSISIGGGINIGGGAAGFPGGGGWNGGVGAGVPRGGWNGGVGAGFPGGGGWNGGVGAGFPGGGGWNGGVGAGFPGGGGWNGGVGAGFPGGGGWNGGVGAGVPGGGWNGGVGAGFPGGGGWNGGGYWNNTGGWDSRNAAWERRQRELEDYRRFQEERRQKMLEEQRRREEEWRRRQEEQRRREEERRRRIQEERDFQEWNNKGNAQAYQDGMRGLYEDFRYSQENLRYGMGRYHGGTPWGVGNIGGSFNIGAYGRMGY